MFASERQASSDCADQASKGSSANAEPWSGVTARR
jgi:hypothetical protein